MRPGEVWRTIRPRPMRLRRTDRLHARVHTVADLQREAARALPAPILDYLEGGADEETTLRENVDAFRARRFQPTSLVDVSAVDTSSRLLERTLPVPVLLAPTGYTRMFHRHGELEVVRAANRVDVPYVVSTMSTTSIEDVARGMDVPPWLQLYLLRDRARSWELLDRAWASGVRVLEFSVDTAVSGRRTRDLRHGLTIPPSLGLRAIADIATRPRYWLQMLSSPALEFANLRNAEGGSIREIGALFETALTWSDVEDLRSRWRGQLLLKGPLSPTDAARAVSSGVDGIHLSNHGGRQLDRCVSPIDALEEVRQSVPSTTVVVDSGVRHGMDIAVAIALGADAVAVGRAYLYGLAADGAAGVGLALAMLHDEFRRTMQLIGVTSTAELRERGRALLAR